MIDIHAYMQAELGDILPVYYEYTMDDAAHVPCLSHYETNNASLADGDSVKWSNIDVCVTIWSDKVSDLATYGPQVDALMHELGFRRIACNELVRGMLLRRIMTFEAIGFEEGE